MPQNPKEIDNEATSENEPATEEQGEYQHIDSFVAGLDDKELAYLKGCLKHHPGNGEGDPSKGEDSTVSEGDFEND